MPHHKSCIKRVRTNQKRNLRNRMARSRMRTSVHNVLDAKKRDEATEVLKTAISIIDKNAKVGIVHKNWAANNKSRLTKYVNSLPG